MTAGGRPPFTLQGIDHVLFLVQGMERALGFYENVLGCTVASRLPQYGMAELKAGRSHIDLVDIAAPEGSWAAPTPEGGRNVDHVCIVLGPHHESDLRSHLATHEVAIVEERLEQTSTGTRLSLYVQDPSGNTIELMGPVRA